MVCEVEAAVARWRDEGSDLGMSPVELEQFTEALEHSEHAVARRLGAKSSPRRHRYRLGCEERDRSTGAEAPERGASHPSPSRKTVSKLLDHRPWVCTFFAVMRLLGSSVPPLGFARPSTVAG